MELLYIAQRLKIPIAEVAVNWTEIEGKYIFDTLGVDGCVIQKGIPGYHSSVNQILHPD